MAKEKDIFLESKPRYEILDGLRGVAALMVIGGWNVYDSRECYIGFTRLLYPFFCGLLLSIAVAYAFLKLYDEPVRNWLKEHWLKR